jgi:hypothetical protein
MRKGLDAPLISGVNKLDREASLIAELRLHFLSAIQAVICQQQLFHPGPRPGNRGDSFAHSPDAD